MVRFTRLPSTSSCQPLRRASRTGSAIMSIAVSRSRSSHSVPYGRRYLTVVTRLGLVTSCLLALPLGHSRPRLIGEAGSPSICTTCSSLTKTRSPQPTAQYGHTLCTTLSAVAVLLTTFSVALLRAALPRPSGSAPVSCRYTGHASSQVFTIRTLPPPAGSGTPTAGSARKPSAPALTGTRASAHTAGCARHHSPEREDAPSGGTAADPIAQRRARTAYSPPVQQRWARRLLAGYLLALAV